MTDNPMATVLPSTPADRDACVCREVSAPNTVHRSDGPCYAVTPQLRVAALAIARTEAWKWADGERLEDHPLWQMYLGYADAVLAVQPVPVDRAAILRDAAARFERECPGAGGSMDLCMCHAAEPLRQWADEAPQPPTAPADACPLHSPTGSPCGCGHAGADDCHPKES